MPGSRVRAAPMATTGRGSRPLGWRGTTLWSWVALMLLTGGLRGTASPMPHITPGAHRPASDSRRTDLVRDEERYALTTGAARGAHAEHGMACPDEDSLHDSIPDRERAVALKATPTNLVALGVAYHRVGRLLDASTRWRQVRRLFSSTPVGQHVNFQSPIGLESAIVARRYAEALITLEQYFSPHSVGGGRSAPYNLVTFDDAALTQPLVDALHVAAQGNPGRGAELIAALYHKGGKWFGEIRYPRAIMLLAMGRPDEARCELRLATRMRTFWAHDPDPHPFQWSALAILERLP